MAHVSMYALRLALGSALIAFRTSVNQFRLAFSPLGRRPLVETPNSVNAETLSRASARSAIMPRSVTMPLSHPAPAWPLS